MNSVTFQQPREARTGGTSITTIRTDREDTTTKTRKSKRGGDATKKGANQATSVAEEAGKVHINGNAADDADNDEKTRCPSNLWYEFIVFFS